MSKKAQEKDVAFLYKALTASIDQTRVALDAMSSRIDLLHVRLDGLKSRLDEMTPEEERLGW